MNNNSFYGAQLMLVLHDNLKHPATWISQSWRSTAHSISFFTACSLKVFSCPDLLQVGRRHFWSAGVAIFTSQLHVLENSCSCNHMQLATSTCCNPAGSSDKNNTRNEIYIPKNPMLEVLHIKVTFFWSRYSLWLPILIFAVSQELPKLATWATKLRLF